MNPFEPPATLSVGPWRGPTLYGMLALGFLAVQPVLMGGHLLFGGMLWSHVIAWQLAHERTTVLPQLIFFGGTLALFAIPMSFAAASRQLRRATPDRRRLWQVLPWLSLLLWPAWMLGLSFVFDVMRWTAGPPP